MEFKYSANEIINQIPQDLDMARVAHPFGYIVDVLRIDLINGLKAVESLQDPNYSLKSINKSIKKLGKKAEKGKKYNKKDLASDVGLWFCFDLLTGDTEFSEAFKMH